MNETTTTAIKAEKRIIRCLRDGWPAFRNVTVTQDGRPVWDGPTCRACLDSLQQDGRYFTASFTIGPVIADDTVSEWHGMARPRTLDEHERNMQLYRVSSDAWRALNATPGWRVERSGTCISLRFEGHGIRRHGDPPDYLIWVESTMDMHLHRTLGGERGVSVAEAYAAACREGAKHDATCSVHEDLRP